MKYFLNSKKHISVVSDQIGCPTSSTSLAFACWKIIQNWEVLNNKTSRREQILHWSDQGVASWYDVAIAIEEIGKELGLVNTESSVKAIESKDFPTLAKRPSFSLLDCYSTREELKLKGQHWRLSLRKILELIKS